MGRLSSRQRVVRQARRRGVLRARDVAARGLHTQILTRLVADGTLERVGRGRYRLPRRAVSEHHGLALAAAAAPRGVICLLSALVFHGLGTQLPPEVWVAMDRRARKPSPPYPPLRVVRFSAPALSSGVERHRVEGQRVRVFSLAKTLADCFKYRHKIGLDVALEALAEALRERRVRPAEIDPFARICRVTRVMRPYVEALIA